MKMYRRWALPEWNWIQDGHMACSNPDCDKVWEQDEYSIGTWLLENAAADEAVAMGALFI